MIIEPFRTNDIAPFLRLAAAENWVAEPWEFVFLLKTFPEGCFCMRNSDGLEVAFVTALRHEKSGWIGNLIVAEEFRGRGFGEAMFRKAQEALHGSGVETLWLTASDSGKALYEKYGFSSIDRIIRWIGTSRTLRAGSTRPVMRAGRSTSVNSFDCKVWGDRRDELLAVTADRGRLLTDESGFVVIQPCGADRQLGPFAACDSVAAERLYHTALNTLEPGSKIYVDAPVSNRAAVRLFTRERMHACSSNELMFAGAVPDYRPELLYGLATMGSCG
ncbi:MAG: GNAT family N-acetyltransferase [Desulfuromonadales bacterium]